MPGVRRPIPWDGAPRALECSYCGMAYETITLGPVYYKMEATVQQMFTQTQNVIAGNQMRMHQAQMASSQRIGQMINDTYAYGIDLNRQSCANTQATMDRVNDMRSESLREVNSCHTGDGRYVESVIGFDNVYRNAARPDWYAAPEGMIDMGSDWVQLKKRY